MVVTTSPVNERLTMIKQNIQNHREDYEFLSMFAFRSHVYALILGLIKVEPTKVFLLK